MPQSILKPLALAAALAAAGAQAQTPTPPTWSTRPAAVELNWTPLKLPTGERYGTPMATLSVGWAFGTLGP
ncbi:hypothetical protein [Caldimonas sp. KR1-144]|uniref:hypothetical protein n=1 Tax=Caldimonas sp. KR1-144 TaxID=3400911 RepID=UPI003C0DC34C